MLRCSEKGLPTQLGRSTGVVGHETSSITCTAAPRASSPCTGSTETAPPLKKNGGSSADIFYPKEAIF